MRVSTTLFQSPPSLNTVALLQPQLAQSFPHPPCSHSSIPILFLPMFALDQHPPAMNATPL